MVQPIEVGLSKKGKAPSIPFVQKPSQAGQAKASTTQDRLATSGSRPVAAKTPVDFVQNPLGAHPPKITGSLPPGSAKKAFTLFDAIAAIGKAMQLNSLVSGNDVDLISKSTKKITELSEKLRAFQAAQRDIEKAMEAEEHRNRILGFVEKAVFGFMAIAFAAMIAGPAGAIAAAIAVGVNTGLQEGGVYAKATKHWSPAEAFALKFGVSIVVGALAGGVTAVGMAAVESAAATEADSAVSSMARSGTRAAVRRGATSAAENAAASAEDQPVQASEAALTDEGSQLTEETTDATTSVFRKLWRGLRKQAIEKGEDNGTGIVKRSSLQKRNRSLWMALNGFQTTASSFTSKSHGEESGHDLWGDMAFALAKSDGKSNDQANSDAGWVQFAATAVTMFAEFGLGSKLMGAEAAESAESFMARAMRMGGNVTFGLNSAAQVGTSIYGAVSAFTQRGQYEQLASLTKETADIEKGSETTRFIQNLYTSALRSSTQTNQRMMTTVFSVIEDINAALGASVAAVAA